MILNLEQALLRFFKFILHFQRNTNLDILTVPLVYDIESHDHVEFFDAFKEYSSIEIWHVCKTIIIQEFDKYLYNIEGLYIY